MTQVCLVHSYTNYSVSFTKSGSALCKTTCVISHLNNARSQQTLTRTILKTVLKKAKQSHLSHNFL